MFLPNPLRKWLSVFRGGVAPALILLSVLFGFWFGLMPGWSGMHVLLLAVVLVVNVPIWMFILFAGLGKALSFAAAPLLFYSGVWAQEHAAGLLNFFAALPIAGLSDYARCAFCGALLLGPLLGLVLGVILVLAVQNFRRTWLRLEENSDALRTWRRIWWVRWLDWLLISSSTKDVRAALSGRGKYIRLPGVGLALLLVVACGAAVSFVKDRYAGEAAAASLTSANGAEVNIAGVDLSIFGGRVAVRGLQVTDPRTPTQNRVALETATADISIMGLLRGKIIIEELELTGLRTDAPRAAAGRVDRPPPPPTSPAQAPPFAPAAGQLPAGAEFADLESYLADAQKLRDWIARVREWLPADAGAPSDAGVPAAGAAPAGPPTPESYLAYLTARTATSPTPRIVIRKLKIADVDIPVEQVGMSAVECENLSDAPSAARLLVKIDVKSSKFASRIGISVDYAADRPVTRVDAQLDGVPLATLQRGLNSGNRVVFQDGTVGAHISGQLTRANVDLALQVGTKGMKLQVGGQGLFGLDQRTAGEAFKVLEDFDTTLRLVGPTAAPRLVFDAGATTAALRDGLVRAGKKELLGQFDKLVGDKLPAGTPLGGAVEQGVGQIGEGLGGLLGGKKKEDSPR